MKKTQKSGNQVQKLLFNQIEGLLPKQLVPAHEIAEVLSLSTDAVYRRLRGEKKLTIDEICTLSEHFNISIDALFRHHHHNISFETIPANSNELDNFLSHLSMLGKTFKRYQLEKKIRILHLAAEIPFVYLASFEELATFKIYAWANSVYNYNGNYSTFCNQIKGDKLFRDYREISAYYQQIPSLEIWNTNSYDSMIGWIEFFYESGNLDSKEIALDLCSQLIQLTNELQIKVEKGIKDGQLKNNLIFYVSDVALENNFMIIKSENLQDCFLRLFSASGMIINDQSYCLEMEKWFNRLHDKSTLVSGSSKKGRHQFFQALTYKIQLLVDKLYHQN
jgi:hypothetical protein